MFVFFDFSFRDFLSFAVGFVCLQHCDGGLQTSMVLLICLDENVPSVA